LSRPLSIVHARSTAAAMITTASGSPMTASQWVATATTAPTAVRVVPMRGQRAVASRPRSSNAPADSSQNPMRSIHASPLVGEHAEAPEEQNSPISRSR
jgi:hypothetical protein